MKTAVDSPVLLDVLGADPRFGEASRAALKHAFDTGSLVACDIVWAEVRAHFTKDSAFEEIVALLGIQFEAIDNRAAVLAGELWRRYRQRAGTPRRRIVPDFLVGAHALLQAEALLTRDRGFYRRDFTRLRILDPSQGRRTSA